MTPSTVLVRRLLFTVFLIATPALAQISGGAFRGDVRDESNGVMSHVRVSIRSRETGLEVVTESNTEGLYITPNLTPGSYLLSAAKPGFKSEIFGPVALEVNQTVRVDFVLAIGSVADSVEVHATAMQLLTPESAELSQVISRKQVSEIPLNGRQWQQLIALSAGVNPGAPGETGSPNPVNVNGQRAKANLFMLDGISTTSSAQGRGNNFNIPLEAVQEFSVQAGAYSAEFGDVAGGVINLESKSGTNNWHGSLFEFFRNDKMDAANFFANATAQPKNPLRYNQFGGSLGGPILHQQDIHFCRLPGYDYAQFSAPMVTSGAAGCSERLGDFSNLRTANGALVPIYDPFGASLARTPFPGNMIPLTSIDPAAANITAVAAAAESVRRDGASASFQQLRGDPIEPLQRALLRYSRRPSVFAEQHTFRAPFFPGHACGYSVSVRFASGRSLLPGQARPWHAIRMRASGTFISSRRPDQ